MLTLIDRNTVPPGGFRYYENSTATTIRAPSFGELLSNVRAHRRANNIALPPELDMQVEAWLCGEMPPGTCRQGDYTPANYVRSLSLGEIITATKTLGQWLIGGREKVHRDEATRRANICSTCPYNKPMAGCTTCGHKEIRELVVSVVGPEQVDADSLLNTCHFCGCTLKAAIWLPLDVLVNNMPKSLREAMPQWCWKK